MARCAALSYVQMAIFGTSRASHAGPGVQDPIAASTDRAMAPRKLNVVHVRT